MCKKWLSAITFVMLAGYMLPAMSEYYVGVDYYAFNTVMKNNNVDTGFYGNQQRIRVGYRGYYVGFEMDLLSNQDDTNASGFLNYKVGPALGAYMLLHGEWFYGKVGALRTDTTLKSVTSGVTADDTLLQFSAALGVEFEVAENLFINADYTYSNGSGNYSNILGADNPNITSQALAAGFKFSF